MRRRTPRLLVALTAAGLALAGCAHRTAGPASAGAGGATPAVAFPVTVGGVTLPQRPSRIVSLSPTATEMLFVIGAGSQIAAVDDQSDYPATAPRSKLSGFKPSAEAIAAKNPDLVVISDDVEKIKEQLASLKIPVYQAPAAKTLDDSYTQLTNLGALTGHAHQAATEVAREKSAIDQAVAQVPKRTTALRYYYELDPTFYSATSKTFIGSLLGQLGLQNIADPADKQGSGYPQLSAESIVKANPDLVFLADTKCCGQSAATVARRPGWSGVTAVQKHQVVALDDAVASRWGPRVVDLVQTVAAAVGKVPAS
ncbi:MAG TPA: ABC transporter substrate-binding protein [Rugosimonospora sp.]|nr:ABC transporter substrate-binding protein [Rugosimonospora sp.]